MCAIIFCISSSTTAVYAGSLVGATNAVVSGTAPYVGTNLLGTVDYAVFLPGRFEAEFGLSTGYTPTPGSAVYAYQIFADPNAATNVPGLPFGIPGVIGML